MRGFSLFAPVIGTVLILIAVATSASYAQNEQQKMSEIMQVRMNTTTTVLPDYMKWDAISTLTAVIRDMTYNNLRIGTGSDFWTAYRKLVGDAIETALGTKDFPSKIDVQGAEINYYVQGNLANEIELKSGDRIVIWADPEKTKDVNFTVQVRQKGGAVTLSTVLRLFDSNVAIPVFLPKEDIEANVEKIKDEAKKVHFLLGFFDAGAPEISVDGVQKPMTNCSGSLDTNSPAESVYPCLVNGLTMDNAANDVLKDWITQHVGVSNVESVRIVSHDPTTRDGIPWYRLICLRKDDKYACVVKEEKSAPYMQVNSVTAELNMKYDQICAPDGSVTPTVIVSLDFNKDEPKVAGGTLKGAKWDNQICKSGLVQGQTKGCSPGLYKYGSEGNADALFACETNCIKMSHNLLDPWDCDEICRENNSYYAIVNGIKKPIRTGECVQHSSAYIEYCVSDENIIAKLKEKLNCSICGGGNKCKSLCDYLKNELGSSVLFDGKPGVSGGPALLDVTVFDITSNSVDGFACVTENTCQG